MTKENDGPRWLNRDDILRHLDGQTAEKRTHSRGQNREADAFAAWTVIRSMHIRGERIPSTVLANVIRRARSVPDDMCELVACKLEGRPQRAGAPRTPALTRQERDEIAREILALPHHQRNAARQRKSRELGNKGIKGSSVSSIEKWCTRVSKGDAMPQM